MASLSENTKTKNLAIIIMTWWSYYWTQLKQSIKIKKITICRYLGKRGNSAYHVTLWQHLFTFFLYVAFTKFISIYLCHSVASLAIYIVYKGILYFDFILWMRLPELLYWVWNGIYYSHMSILLMSIIFSFALGSIHLTTHWIFLIKIMSEDACMPVNNVLSVTVVATVL